MTSQRRRQIVVTSRRQFESIETHRNRNHNAATSPATRCRGLLLSFFAALSQLRRKKRKWRGNVQTKRPGLCVSHDWFLFQLSFCPYFYQNMNPQLKCYLCIYLIELTICSLYMHAYNTRFLIQFSFLTYARRSRSLLINFYIYFVDQYNMAKGGITFIVPGSPPPSRASGSRPSTATGSRPDTGTGSRMSRPCSTRLVR